MRFFFYFALLCSFLALVPYALEVSDFQFPPMDDSLEETSSLQEPLFDDTLPWDGNFGDISDSSNFFASGCSAFPPSINRKRLRRRDSPSFCNADSPPTGSTNRGIQDNGNGHFSSGSIDDTIDPNIPLGDLFSIPALATYPNEKNDDCFRLSRGKLPLAVCDLGGGNEYIFEGLGYRDLDFSYPSKEMHYFLIYLFFVANILSFWIDSLG